MMGGESGGGLTLTPPQNDNAISSLEESKKTNASEPKLKKIGTDNPLISVNELF